MWHAGKPGLIAVVIWIGATMAWAADARPQDNKAVSAKFGSRAATACYQAPYCPKPAPCIKCPPVGRYAACYSPKPLPCVKCPSVGNYAAPYCPKPLPDTCNLRLPCQAACDPCQR